MKTIISIADCALLTPLDEAGGGRDTWQRLCADNCIEGEMPVADALLAGETDVDRSIRLALGAVARLKVDVRDVHLFCGTSKGPITTYLAAADAIRCGGGVTEAQARHIALGVGAMGAMVRERLKIRGPAHTSVAACSSGMYAFHRACLAVDRGECGRALVVAADASLHPLFEGSFARLGVLSPADDKGVRRCEPFGEKGDGFFLVEAAAAVMVERTEKGAAQIEGTWIGADSTGLIAIDEETRTLRALLAARGGGDVAFVHAHATGTGHDRYELAAIRGVAPASAEIFSHKKWLGHSLGAAGLVSVVVSAMAHRAGRTPGGKAIPPDGRSLTIAQGFGGHIGLVAMRSA